MPNGFQPYPMYHNQLGWVLVTSECTGSTVYVRTADARLFCVGVQSLSDLKAQNDQAQQPGHRNAEQTRNAMAKPKAKAGFAGAQCSVASRDIHEAIERLMTLAGIAMSPGWDLGDADIPRKLDQVRVLLVDLFVGERPNDQAEAPEPR